MNNRQKPKLVLAIVMVFVATTLFLPGLIRGGSTKHTLDEIYDMLAQLVGGPAPVEKTGQTTSYATGDDGELEGGVTWPNPRFTDNSDGTVTDNLTGLIWLKKANCFGIKTWNQALSDCNGLADGECGLTDGSIAGDWRLPHLRELQSVIHYGVYNLAVPDTAGTGQLTEGDPFTGVTWAHYWTSTTSADSTNTAWVIDFYDGDVNDNAAKGGVNGYVWCARGGQ
jgi:hypothetical protein